MATLQFPTARIPQERPDPIAWATQDIRAGAIDFLTAAHAAATVDEALRLRSQLSNLIVELSAIEDCILERADALVGKAGHES